MLADTEAAGGYDNSGRKLKWRIRKIRTKRQSKIPLPFPPTPSASIAGRTMQESVYRQRVTPRRLPADAPNIVIVLIDDAGPALPIYVRR